MITNKKRERQWKKGLHTDADGKEWPLDEMTDAHLAKTINSFPMLEAVGLRVEFRKRQHKPIEVVISLLEQEAKLKPKTTKQELRIKLARKAKTALAKYSKSKP